MHTIVRRATLALAVTAVAGVGFLLRPATVAVSASAEPAFTGKTETAVLAGGCFWGMESVFEHVRGVTKVVAGFSGGDESTAHYEDVSSGTTGHAESVEVTYDPARISYTALLDVYFRVAHDPTEVNRQGPDDGTQYRSAIFYRNEGQHIAAEREMAQLRAEHVFDAPIATQLVAFRAFYPAEAYHQHYAALHPYDPYIVINDAPKVAALKRRFPDLTRG